MEDHKVRKLLFVLDHEYEDMFYQVNRQLESNFAHSVIGRILKNRIINHPRIGIDTHNSQYTFKFLYNQVPRKNKQTNSYIKPAQSKLQPYFDKLVNFIQNYQPDVIVAYGTWFMNLLVKQYKLDKSKMNLIPLDLNGFKTYIFFAPSLKRLNQMGSYDRDKLIIGNRMINRFLKGGIENTKPQMGTYHLIMDYDKVKYIFHEILPRYPIIAMDFETNTLETYRKGAKAIMCSLSWQEHQGVAIPLSHRLSPNLWTKEQFNSIIKMIKQLIMSKQPIVGHNFSYDIRMMMDIYGLPYATNCRDTMLMYYELIDERQGTPRGLKHLAYKYTNMGGYEDKRDQYFQEYLDNDYKKWYQAEMAKYKAGKRKKKPLKSQYQPPYNHVDGSKIDFEWLPISIIYPYAAADTDVTLQLYHIFDKKIQQNKAKFPKWEWLCYSFFPKLENVLCYMTHTGLQLDVDKLAKYRKHFKQDIKRLTQEMYDSTPENKQLENKRLGLIQKREEIKAIKPKDRTPEQKKFFTKNAKWLGKDNNGNPKYKFNPGSSKDIGYIFFKIIGYELPTDKDYLKPKAVQQRKLSNPEKLKWSDYKTDRKVVLPYLKNTYHDKLADLLLQYSTDKKMLSSTIDGYSKLLDDKGRAHPHYLIHGTVTNRLASRDFNAQNIKKPTSNVNDPNYHYGAKDLFISRFKDGYLFNIDFKSLEVFIASVLSHDTGMMQALMDVADIHKLNASIAFDIPYREVDPAHRLLAKAVTFG